MVNQLCTEIVGFVMHHLADAVPSEASTLWFLVISGSVQLACSLAVRMPVPITVVLGLPTEQESIAEVGALVCSNLRIADGLSPIPWNAVYENFAEDCPMDYSCVPEKAKGEQESEEEVEEVGATPENVVYGTPKQSRGPSKEGGRTRNGDENKASSSQSKGKGNKKAQASPPDEPAAAGTDSQSSASKKGKIGFQAWKDRFNGSKKNQTCTVVVAVGCTLLLYTCSGTTISIHHIYTLWHPVGVPICSLCPSGLFSLFSLHQHGTDSPLSLFYLIWLRTTPSFVECSNFSLVCGSCVRNQTIVCDYCPCAAGFGEIFLFLDKLQCFTFCRTNFDENGMRRRVVPPLV